MSKKLWKLLWGILVVLTLYNMVGVVLDIVSISKFAYELALALLFIFEVLMFNAEIKIK